MIVPEVFCKYGIENFANLNGPLRFTSKTLFHSNSEILKFHVIV
jgi:hypothetical protein